MNVTVIIPVGPGHENFAFGAAKSALDAWRSSPGPFSKMAVEMIADTGVGRSATRNKGLAKPSDFYFLLDADDEMTVNAFSLVELHYPATFGAVCLNGKISRHNVWPVNRQTLFERGALGTLSMGCFVRDDVKERFDESLDNGEDYDFYMRLPDFVKVKMPLVSIGYDKPSAGGARGANHGNNWVETCNAVIDRYREGRGQLFAVEAGMAR